MNADAMEASSVFAGFTGRLAFHAPRSTLNARRFTPPRPVFPFRAFRAFRGSILRNPHEDRNAQVITPQKDTTGKPPVQSDPVKASQSQSKCIPSAEHPTRSGSIRLNPARSDYFCHTQGISTLGAATSCRRPARSDRLRLDPTTFVTAKRTAAGRSQDLQDGMYSTLNAQRSTLHNFSSCPSCSSCLPLSCISCISWFRFYETNPNRKIKSFICKGLRNERISILQNEPK